MNIFKLVGRNLKTLYMKNPIQMAWITMGLLAINLPLHWSVSLIWLTVIILNCSHLNAYGNK